MKNVFVIMFFFLCGIANAQNIYENLPYKEDLNTVKNYLTQKGYTSIVFQDTIIDNRKILFDKTVSIKIILKNNDGDKCLIDHRIFIKNDKYANQRIKGISNAGDSIDVTWKVLIDEGHAFYDNNIIFEFNKKTPALNKKPKMLGDYNNGDTYYSQLYKNYYIISPTYYGLTLLKKNIKTLFK